MSTTCLHLYSIGDDFGAAKGETLPVFACYPRKMAAIAAVWECAAIRCALASISAQTSPWFERLWPVCDTKNPAGWSWMEGARIEILPGMDPLTAFTFRLAAIFLRELVPPSVREPLEPYFARADEILEKTPGLELGRWADKVCVLSRSNLLLAPSVVQGCTLLSAMR